MKLIGNTVKKESVVGKGYIRRVDVPLGSDISLWINLTLKNNTVNNLDPNNNKLLVSIDNPNFGAEFKNKYKGKKLRVFIRDGVGSGEEFQEYAVKDWDNHFYGLEIDL